MSLLFSIVIPTYNRAHLLPTTIDTVLKQSYGNFELIVVDDGSADNTAEVVKEIIAANPAKISYMYQANSERSVARNNGLRKASGDYVLFFDSDDTLYPNHLQVAYDYILAHNRPEFLHLGYDIKNSKGEVISERPVHHDFPNKKLITGNFLSCNGVFVRRDIALTHLFNEDRRLSAMEDWELWLRLCAEYPLHYVNTITSSVFNHDDRSVIVIKKEALIGSAELIIRYVTNNVKVTQYFKGDIRKFKASCYSYVSLHLGLSGLYKKDSFIYLMRSLRQWPGLIFQRRFLAIIRRLF